MFIVLKFVAHYFLHIAELEQIDWHWSCEYFKNPSLDFFVVDTQVFVKDWSEKYTLGPRYDGQYWNKSTFQYCYLLNNTAIF